MSRACHRSLHTVELRRSVTVRSRGLGSKVWFVDKGFFRKVTYNSYNQVVSPQPLNLVEFVLEILPSFQIPCWRIPLILQGNIATSPKIFWWGWTPGSILNQLEDVYLKIRNAIPVGQSLGHPTANAVVEWAQNHWKNLIYSHWKHLGIAIFVASL